MCNYPPSGPYTIVIKWAQPTSEFGQRTGHRVAMAGHGGRAAIGRALHRRELLRRHRELAPLRLRGHGLAAPPLLRDAGGGELETAAGARVVNCGGGARRGHHVALDVPREDADELDPPAVRRVLPPREPRHLAVGGTVSFVRPSMNSFPS